MQIFRPQPVVVGEEPALGVRRCRRRLQMFGVGAVEGVLVVVIPGGDPPLNRVIVAQRCGDRGTQLLRYSPWNGAGEGNRCDLVLEVSRWLMIEEICEVASVAVIWLLWMSPIKLPRFVRVSAEVLEQTVDRAHVGTKRRARLRLRWRGGGLFLLRGCERRSWLTERNALRRGQRWCFLAPPRRDW